MSSGKMSLLSFSVLALQALGIVFGDIGTSPLYVLTAMLGTDSKFYTESHIIGAIGLICWTLIIVVTAFYCGTVLRVNQHGDGGITVLRGKVHRRADQLWAHVGIAGVIADGQITPTISVLSAWWGGCSRSRGTKRSPSPYRIKPYKADGSHMLAKRR